MWRTIPHTMKTNFYGNISLLTAVAVHQAAFGLGTGPVFLSNLRCTGTESSLLSCGHLIGVTSCSHFNDAGVVCHPCKPLCKLFLLVRCYMNNRNGFSYHGIICMPVSMYKLQKTFPLPV